VNASSTTVSGGVAKASTHGLTHALAQELAAEGILINIVMPCPTQTGLLAGLTPVAKDHLAQTSLLKHLLNPQEVASGIVFLVSAVNTAITGEVLRVSGGKTA
jgi:3-oxoacyl-[acyl-carrier protein] reductase